jgi:hypothetical protein
LLNLSSDVELIHRFHRKRHHRKIAKHHMNAKYRDRDQYVTLSHHRRQRRSRSFLRDNHVLRDALGNIQISDDPMCLDRAL